MIAPVPFWLVAVGVLLAYAIGVWAGVRLQRAWDRLDAARERAHTRAGLVEWAPVGSTGQQTGTSGGWHFVLTEIAAPDHRSSEWEVEADKAPAEPFDSPVTYTVVRPTRADALMVCEQIAAGSLPVDAERVQ